MSLRPLFHLSLKNPGMLLADSYIEERTCWEKMCRDRVGWTGCRSSGSWKGKGSPEGKKEWQQRHCRREGMSSLLNIDTFFPDNSALGKELPKQLDLVLPALVHTPRVPKMVAGTRVEEWKGWTLKGMFDGRGAWEHMDLLVSISQSDRVGSKGLAHSFKRQLLWLNEACILVLLIFSFRTPGQNIWISTILSVKCR